jgi:ADP-ribose pyrophosphatase YjhB (NUDIX family)
MTFNAASLALFDGDRVLLIKRARSPFLNYWTLAGGRREGIETAEHCALREYREETGLVVTNPRPVTIIDIGRNGYAFWLAIFASTSFSGELTGSDEISGHQWIDSRALGELLVTPELPHVLARARATLLHSAGNAL